MVCPAAPGLSPPDNVSWHVRSCKKSGKQQKKNDPHRAPPTPKCGPKTSKAPLSFPLTHYGWKRHSIGLRVGSGRPLKKARRRWRCWCWEESAFQRLPFWRPTVVYKSFVSGHAFLCPPCIACLNPLSILPGFFFFFVGFLEDKWNSKLDDATDVLFSRSSSHWTGSGTWKALGPSFFLRYYKLSQHDPFVGCFCFP